MTTTRAEGTWPLEADRETIVSMAAKAADLVADFVDGLDEAPSINVDGVEPLVKELLRPPSEEPGDFDARLAQFQVAMGSAVETAGPGYMAYIGGGGMYTAAVAEYLTRATHRFTGLAGLAPALVAMEESVLRWLAGVFGLPSSSGGQITTGGSMGTLAALVAARTDRLGDHVSDGTLYVTEQTHRCVAKAARIIGLRPDQIRTVPSTPQLRMEPAAAEAMIRDDRARGRRPLLLVGTAGTPNTGVVDPLPTLAEVAQRHGLWFHVDGAYGGLFQLTERGAARLTGIQHADSLVLDPHKTLFMPYGTGVVLVRDRQTLHRAFAEEADYLQDLTDELGLPDYAYLGPELTREHRGFRLWLPLHVHGVAAFREALDEKLDLAQHAYQRLSAQPRLELAGRPDLAIVAFRLSPASRADAPAWAEHANQELLERVNASKRIHISSTRLNGELWLRLSVLAHRLHRDRVDEAVDIITAAADAVSRTGR
jgi:aromatic-L-amino-acid/L-tryptophan decarboxylase